MIDPEHIPTISEPSGEVEAGANELQGTPDLVKKVTHELDTDDMFAQGGE